MQTIKYYEVHDCFDTEGRGPEKVIGRFSNENIAYNYAIKRGNYGHDAKVREVEVVICENMSEWQQYINSEAKKKALAKLTIEERQLLGL